MRYYHTPIRMAKIKIVTIPNAGEDSEKLEHSYITEGNLNVTPTLENRLTVSYKANHEIIIYMIQQLHSWVSIPEK